jgi:hypothetical protein
LKTEAHRGLIHSLTTSPWIAGLKAIQCSHADCSRWLTQRHLATRKVGVTMQGCWFCSYGCFNSIATARLRQLSVTTPAQSTRTMRMPLSLILINRGCLTQEQSKLATIEQGQTGVEIGDTLIRLGFVDEKDVVSARSIQWDCPVFSAATHPLSFQHRSTHIPLTLLYTHSMAPLHYIAATNTLLIGFIYSVEYAVLYAVEQMTGCRTKACLITPSDFELQMHRRTEQPPPNDLTFDNVQGPSKMAHVLCNYGALLNADEISIGRCREYLWARMNTPTGLSNLLFKVT